MLAGRDDVPRHLDDRVGEVRYGDWSGRSSPSSRRPVVEGRPGAPVGHDLPRRAARPCGTCRCAPSAVREWNAGRGDDAVYAVVSHGDVIKAVVADALGLHLDQFQRLVVDPGSVSIVPYTPLRPFVVRLNDTGGDLSSSPRTAPAQGRLRARRPGRPGRGRRGRWRRGSADLRRHRVEHGAHRLRVRPAGPLRRRARSGARAAHLLPPGPGGGPGDERRAREAAGVALLAERVDALLDEVVRRSAGEARSPAAPADRGSRHRWTSPSRRSSGSARWPSPGTATTTAW